MEVLYEVTTSCVVIVTAKTSTPIVSYRVSTSGMVTATPMSSCATAVANRINNSGTMESRRQLIILGLNGGALSICS